MTISSDLIGQRKQRIEHMQKLRELGINPYPARSQKDKANEEVKTNFSDYDGKTLTLAGRLMGKREHGKLIFGDLQDESGTIQIAIKKDVLQADLAQSYLGWDEIKYIDIGDFIQVEGTVGQTAQGEITLFVLHFKLLSKSLRPLPVKMDDKEQQFRRRYLDLTVNAQRKALFQRKAKFWEVNRMVMKKNGFIEVETPVLEHVTGGADATPFTTHHNALDQDFFLRISTELYQKRLIGAGFEKIFTLGPNFRNEGLSDEHLQEFYQIEWYWAYANYRDNMKLVTDLFRTIAQEVYGKTTFTTRGHSFDLADEWKEISYPDIIKERYDIDIFEDPDEKMMQALKKHNLELTGAVNRNRLIDNLWKLIRKEISGPAFLINEPKFMSPLAKSKPDDERLTERFHILIAGSELGNGYTEINDPLDQLDRFLDQQKMRDTGDTEAQMLDIDYVEMLEFGMPPTSGFGMSERVFWFLENVTAREGTFFPQMRTEYDDITKKIYAGQISFEEKSLFEDLKKPELFSIGSDAAKQWPTINIGFAIIKGVQIQKSLPELEEEKAALIERVQKMTTDDINAMPSIQSYRKMYKEMKVDWHSRRPSPEALLRRVIKGKGLYTVNTCVDAYNLVVMKHGISSGAFDLDTIEFPTVLRLAKEGETIHLLGDAEPTVYMPTEIAYFDQKGGYNIDFNYRDSQRTAVTLETKNLMINIDGVYDISRKQVEHTLKETLDIITKYCGGTVEIAGIVSST